MRRTRTKKLSSQRQRGLILILSGLFFLGGAVFLKVDQEFRQNSLSFSKAPDFSERVEEVDLPKRILIPKVKIDLPVFPGKVVNNNWEIAKEGVSYLMGSGIPGRKGNTVIYGHNKRSQFGPIRWLEKGSEIKVINGKGEEFIYLVQEIKTVSPQEVEVLSPTEDPTLTLYTCAGILDKKRFVVVAKLSLD
jgi:sortase A